MLDPCMPRVPIYQEHYSCLVWYSGLKQIQKNNLQILQNKTVRFAIDLHPPPPPGLI